MWLSAKQHFIVVCVCNLGCKEHTKEGSWKLQQWSSPPQTFINSQTELPVPLLHHFFFVSFLENHYRVCRQMFALIWIKLKKKICKFSFWRHWTVPRRQESHNALRQTSGHIALGSIGLELEHFLNLWSLNCVQANHGVKLFFKGYSVAVYSGTWSAFYAPREACPRWGQDILYIQAIDCAFKPIRIDSSMPCWRDI